MTRVQKIDQMIEDNYPREEFSGDLIMTRHFLLIFILHALETLEQERNIVLGGGLSVPTHCPCCIKNQSPTAIA